MPRKASRGRQGKNIGQRFNNGITSGVTIVTIPSGTTVANAGITTPLVTAASIVNSSNSGYPVTGLTDAIMVVSGTTRTKGGVSQVFTATGSGAGAYFGLGMTTITAMMVSAGLETGTSQFYAYVSNDGLTTHATVYYNTADSGASYGSSVSIDYIAIGT